MDKKSINILGLGNRSTLFYINELNRQYNSFFGGFSTCPFILYNANFDKINPYLPNNFEKLKPALNAELNRIVHSEDSLLLIPNITLHETFDQLQIDTTIAHPIELTINKLINNNQNKATVLGSLYTMESIYLKDKFKQHGIELIEPSHKEKLYVDYFRQQVYNKQETVKEIEEYQKTVNEYSQQHAVIIGCSELSIFPPSETDNTYDMINIQIDFAISHLLKNN